MENLLALAAQKPSTLIDQGVPAAGQEQSYLTSDSEFKSTCLCTYTEPGMHNAEAQRTHSQIICAWNIHSARRDSSRTQHAIVFSWRTKRNSKSVLQPRGICSHDRALTLLDFLHSDIAIRQYDRCYCRTYVMVRMNQGHAVQCGATASTSIDITSLPTQRRED